MKFVFLLFLFSFNLNAELRDNFSVLDSLTKAQATKISDLIIDKNIKEFELILTSPYNTVIFEANLNQEFEKKELLNVFGEDSLIVKVLKYGIKYTSILNDSLERIVELRSYVLNKTLNNIYIDTINRDDVKFIENTNFDELKAQIPARKLTLWEKILEPFIVIGSMLVFVLLLFNVRS